MKLLYEVFKNSQYYKEDSIETYKEGFYNGMILGLSRGMFNRNFDDLDVQQLQAVLDVVTKLNEELEATNAS